MASPMSASILVQILRAEGLEVHEYRSWRTHNRNHRGAWGPINGVMIHHTVTSADSDTVGLCYRGYESLPGPLCHGVITKSGAVYLVGNGRANHAGLGDDNVLSAVIAERSDLPAPNERNTDGNARFYGFECVNLGDGEDPWPAAQLEAIEKATAAICRHYGWSAESALGHKEWSYTKVDPRGFSMEGMRRRINERLARPAGSKEDDMPSMDELERLVRRVVREEAGKAVLTQDGVIKVEGASAENPTWQFKAVVQLMQQNQNDMLDMLARIAASVEGLSAEELERRLESFRLRIESPDQ